MPEAYRERVFELFQRLDAGSTGNASARFVLEFPDHAVVAP